MADEIVVKVGTGVFTNENSRTGIVCNVRSLDNRFSLACDLYTRCLHTTYAHLGNVEIGVCNADSHSSGTRYIKTYEKRVVNVLSGNRNIGGNDPCAVELGAHDRDTAPQMNSFRGIHRDLLQSYLQGGRGPGQLRWWGFHSGRPPSFEATSLFQTEASVPRWSPPSTASLPGTPQMPQEGREETKSSQEIAAEISEQAFPAADILA